MFRHILFPVDFSDRCVSAAPYVAALARQFKSRVTLAHATGDFADIRTPDAPSPDKWIQWLHDTGTSKLSAFHAAHFASNIAGQVVLDGEPSNAIVRYAERQGVDLITMPTHGRGAFRQLLLGSVTSKVLHDSCCPVWTMRHAGSDKPDKTATIRNIVCAIDLTDDDLHVFEMARKIASICGATVQLAHAVVVPNPSRAARITPEFNAFLTDSALRQIAALQKDAGTSCKVFVELGSVSMIIRLAAEACNADLVVIGRGRLQASLGRLRSNVPNIIQRSPCPVLSL